MLKIEGNYSKIPLVFNIKIIDNKHSIFSGIRRYITGKASHKNKNDNTAANTSLSKKDTKGVALLGEEQKIKLAQSSLDASKAAAKDRFLSISAKAYLDKYSDFSIKNRKIIKEKYYNKTGIYLWLNNINNKSYVGLRSCS